MKTIKQNKKSIRRMNDTEYSQWEVYQNLWDKVMNNGDSIYNTKDHIKTTIENLNLIDVMFLKDKKEIKLLLNTLNNKLKTITTIGELK